MKRNGVIDFLKFIFALQIVLYHGKNFACEGGGKIISRRSDCGGVFPDYIGISDGGFGCKKDEKKTALFGWYGDGRFFMA